MDWFVGLLLLLVGGIIGFFVAKFFSKTKQNVSVKAESEQTIHELMNQQAIMHVHETKQLAESLIAQSATLKQQVENYEQLLINQNTGPDGSSMNYFGDQTDTYLRKINRKPAREKSSSDVQPLDFSSQSSGLFSGNAAAPVKETK